MDNNMDNLHTQQRTTIIGLVIAVAVLLGVIGGATAGIFLYDDIDQQLRTLGIQLKDRPADVVTPDDTPDTYTPQTSQEERIVQVVEEVSSSVVSVAVLKEVQLFSGNFFFRVPAGTEVQEVGGGTGFLVSSDGLVLTNRHVVDDEEADYEVITADGARYTATVLARDPFQDLAVMQIDETIDQHYRPLRLANSEHVRVGQTVIAIGNALGSFGNSVSVGIVSGLGREVTARGSGGFAETIDGLIQTDAAINSGNSGGPLLNLAGEVIGVNTAVARGAENIGFSIPINFAKRDIQQVRETGTITYPFLGVCWQQLTPQLAESLEISTTEGALIAEGVGCSSAIAPDSAAEVAGLQADDIILTWNSEKLTTDFSLGKAIQQYGPGDLVRLEVLRAGETITVDVVLGEREG